MSLKSKIDQYEVLLTEMFRILDCIEETEEGRKFRPTHISSCRAVDAEKLENIFIMLKHTMKDFG